MVKPEAFERAVKDVLRHKYRQGLFDKNAYLYSKDPIQLDSKEERQTAYDIATQSVVLLENKGILPLRGKQNIFVTGPNANTMWAMCGDYSFPAMTYFWKKVTEDLDHPHIVKLLEGMKDRKPAGINISYSRGCDWTDTIETKYAVSGDERAWEYEVLHRKVDSGEKADETEALAMAKEADVIIAAVGENVMLCGENRDRQGLCLPGHQEQYVERLLATGKPVVLVVFGGRAQVISNIANRCAAVIQAWYPGEEGGHAVADILYGNVSPSAKLSVSYPNVELDEPICYNYSAKQDSRVAWPFGYGLSYTTFDYSNLEVPAEVKTSDESLHIAFEVANTGKMDADEIAQVYLSPTQENQNIRPIQLQGFARISLKAGERKKVKVKLYTEQFGYYSNNGKRQWNIAPGTFTVKIGASSQDIKLQKNITVKGDIVVKTLRDFYFSEVIK
jgi:beta-glucosidase